VRPGTYCEPKHDHGRQPGHHRPDDARRAQGPGLPGLQRRPGDAVVLPHRAYPKPVDVKTHRELPDFISNRGGIALRPGDGVIHSWLNRMLLPDTVGTGGDSHTRFPIGISFPAGSGLVAFGAATGVMPLDMPESVLVRFKGKMQPGVTLRDLVTRSRCTRSRPVC
jgi:aconitate hydratase 2/2-methylisocitrate dehydratase